MNVHLRTMSAIVAPTIPRLQHARQHNILGEISRAVASGGVCRVWLSKYLTISIGLAPRPRPLPCRLPNIRALRNGNGLRTLEGQACLARVCYWLLSCAVFIANKRPFQWKPKPREREDEHSSLHRRVSLKANSFSRRLQQKSKNLSEL